MQLIPILVDIISEQGESSGKPPEVEGYFDRCFYTPLGGMIASALSRTAVTPNQVSWLSVAAAAAAAACYLVPSLAAALGATTLFLFSGILDSADGQLARTTQRTSELGETLDGVCDSLSFGLVYLVAATLFVRGGGSLPMIAILMILAGISHSIQSSLVDFERQLFIHFTTGRGRVLRERPDLLDAEQRARRAAGEGWWPQLLRVMRRGYCARQRRWLASSVTLLDLHAACVAPYPERRRWFAERYREATRTTLKAWTLLAPNSHTLGVLACGLLPFVAPGIGWLRWGLPLVFGFDLILNLAMGPLILLQGRLDRALMRELLTVDPSSGRGAQLAR